MKLFLATFSCFYLFFTSNAKADATVTRTQCICRHATQYSGGMTGTPEVSPFVIQFAEVDFEVCSPRPFVHMNVNSPLPRLFIIRSGLSPPT